MKFTMPKASKESLEKLLEYLGDTSNYSEYYSGNRAEDFKKCFDVESEWCWKYADLLLRGLEKRKLGYKEGHHGIPRAFYGVKRCSLKIDSGNWFVLSYGEHLWAHYCLARCATGKMQGKMARAFILMYNVVVSGSKTLIPSEAELLGVIPEIELRRLQAMEPQWAKVEAEGRTHKSEDPKQYYKDYREANRDKYAEYYKEYHEVNREKISEKRKASYYANREKILEQMKAYTEANKEKIAERNKAYYEANKDKIIEQSKAYAEANKEKIAEYYKAYCEVNREKIAKRKKAYREVNREKLAEHHKAYYEANREKLAEQQKARYEAKKAAGYRQRKNPVTGKKHWVFVGLPETKITEVA